MADVTAVTSLGDEDVEIAPARMPASVGIPLGVSLCAHLAAIVYATSDDLLLGATLFLMGQIVLAFALLRIINGKWVFQDIRFFCAVFLSLYGGTLPLILAAQSGHERGVVEAAFLYGTGLLGFNLVQWWFRQPWRDVSPEVFDRIRPTAANSVFFGMMILMILGFAASRGIRFALSIDRSQLKYLSGQLWIVLIFVVNGMGMYMFAGWGRLSHRSRIALVISTTIFVLFEVSLGNRRDFLPILICIAATTATRRRSVITSGTVAAGFVAFASLTVMGVIRQVRLYPMLLATNPVQLFLGNNEFISPIETLAFYTTRHKPLLWGWTYLSAPSLFFPRAFWPDKPESLSIQFLREAFGNPFGMGYAYTPLTEAFLNFGWVGPFVVMSVLSLLMVKLVRNVDSYAPLYFILFAMTLDFNRGEFSGTLYSIAFVGAGYMAMRLVSQLRWASTPRRTGWPALAATSRPRGD